LSLTNPSSTYCHLACRRTILSFALTAHFSGNPALIVIPWILISIGTSCLTVGLWLSINSSYIHTVQTMLRKKSPSILIPIHVNTCHWVALVRRSINNTVYFLYSNDINLHNVRDTIRYSYSRERTSDLFHPPDAVWINFNSFTYSPHTNECGPRSILALTVLSCHPNPSENILLPLMDDNIAQLCRWWIAECLIDETVDITPFARQYSTTIPYSTTTWTRSSHPFNRPKQIPIQHFHLSLSLKTQFQHPIPQ